MSKTTPLEDLLDVVASSEGLTSEEMDREMLEMGIDVKVAKASVLGTIKTCRAELKRRRLDDARNQRTKAAGRHAELLAGIQQLRLLPDVLISRIQGMAGAVAHRELKSMSQEDLESELADLMALEEEQKRNG